MEQTQPKKKLNFQPCNEFLLCKKLPGEEKVGSIYLADPDKWQKRAEVVAVSPALVPYINKFEEGDIIIYPLGAREMQVQIDGEDYFIFKKAEVVAIIKP